MNISSILRVLFDAILPRKQRLMRTEERSLQDIPLFPASHELHGTQIVTILDYRESAVAELVQSLKYDSSSHAAKLCALLLADYLHEEISSVRSFSSKSILLVPVPLHKERVHERGFNQVERVLQLLPPEFRDGQLSLLSEALARTRATKQQTRLSREARLRNVAGAFAVHDAAVVSNAHIFLIDDVVTTGATLAEASKPLVRAGATVTLLALARA